MYSEKEGLVTVAEKIKQEATVKIEKPGPIRILLISDLHMFDPSSDKEYIESVFKELDKANTYAILLGDNIQGFHPDRAAMAAGVPRLDDQMLTAEKRLQKYSDKGKLIAAVDGNHEGWGDAQMTLNVTYYMMRGFKAIDGSPLPIMNNGGYVNLEFPNGGIHRVRVYHNPGSGGSANNPVGSERARAAEVMIDGSKSPDQVSGGHYHSRAAITTELIINAVDGQVVSQTFSSSGTAQGIDNNNPNVFLSSKATSPSKMGLAANIIVPDDNSRSLSRYDVWGLDNSDKLLSAMVLWNNLESRNMGGEIEEKIRSKISKTQAIFNEKESVKVPRLQNGEKFKSYSYDSVRWDLTSELPIVLYFIGGARYGSSTTNEVNLKELIGQINANPEAFGMILRRMVDQELSKREDREIYLKRMIDSVSPAASKGKILSLLMDVGLREASWKKKIGRNNNLNSKNGLGRLSINTGDYIQERLDKVPLAVNNTSLFMRFNENIDYRIWIRDKLGANGSTINPFGGLETQRRKNRTSMDVAVGGHMVRVGVAQSEDGITVAPGGFAKWAEMGEANEESFPIGGQAVILYPNEKRIFACVTSTEAKDLHKAVFYAEGLKFIPDEERKKILSLRAKKLKSRKID